MRYRALLRQSADFAARPTQRRTSMQLLKASWVLTLVVALGLTGCERGGQRVKMEKPPNPLTTARHAPVSGDQLAGNRKAMVRAAQLNVADAVATLGGFVYHATQTYTYKKGTRTILLKETYTLAQRADGSFRALLTNSRNKGYEVRWVSDALYQKERFRPFREISREAAVAHRWQRRGWGRWRAIVGLFGPQLALSSAGATQHLQRKCDLYKISLLEQPQKIALSTQGSAWGGAVPNSTRGAAAKLTRKLMGASGRVCIDRKSGIALKVNFTGSYSLVGAKQTTIAEIKLNAAVKSLGDPEVKTPAKVVAIKREPEPKDPFAGSNKPGFVQEPPDPRNKNKKRKRRKKRR